MCIYLVFYSQLCFNINATGRSLMISNQVQITKTKEFFVAHAHKFCLILLIPRKFVQSAGKKSQEAESHIWSGLWFLPFLWYYKSILNTVIYQIPISVNGIQIYGYRKQIKSSLKTAELVNQLKCGLYKEHVVSVLLINTFYNFLNSETKNEIESVNEKREGIAIMGIS